ncbi:DUF1281 family ferredoxin-like fold protein [Mucilaginibacter gilvus]|uniref:YubB ferredoxin-like domain-containing protein n=1 Tax=Mucilaginibacter gilvus TaxID=2305909 RepID=A0A3S3X186_9SPHI|nr:hypothetical protein [Mucilaginibacter gilvus]RWY48340.1 hypothetical protein EPL05_19550 [Mucilaginibacter gilvus]
MANWCSNTVEFIGEHSQFEYLEVLFTAMAAKEKKECKGQLPAFVNEKDTGYLFETRWEGGILYYETKWSPNFGVMKHIAEHFRIGFIHRYAEPGNMVYGEASYKDGVFTDVFLQPVDYDLCGFDEDTDTYTFEGNTYESNDEILEILLERKKEAQALQDLNNNEY